MHEEVGSQATSMRTREIKNLKKQVSQLIMKLYDVSLERTEIDDKKQLSKCEKQNLSRRRLVC